MPQNIVVTTDIPKTRITELMFEPIMENIGHVFVRKSIVVNVQFSQLLETSMLSDLLNKFVVTPASQEKEQIGKV